MKISFSDDDLLSLTPYSCCKKDSVCYGNAVAEKGAKNWIEMPATINMTLINEQGCLQIFSERLDDICVIIIVVVGIVCLLQVKWIHFNAHLKLNLVYSQIFILILMVVLMYNKRTETKRTSNYQSQTDLPRGVSKTSLYSVIFTHFLFQTPILLNDCESIEIVDQCEQTDDNGYTFQQKSSQQFILKDYGRKNRVGFADVLTSAGEDETSMLLAETAN